MNIKNFSASKIMISLTICYIAILAFLFFFQRNLQYHPSGEVVKPSDMSDFQDKILTTKDRVKILAWYKKIENAKAVLYFHGNAGNLSERSAMLKKFSDNGFAVMAISYQGYPGSQGKPSEAGLINDAKAALQFLLDEGYKLDNIIFFGESLGSSVAVQLAAEFTPRAVVLEAPFATAYDIGQKRYPFAPVKLLLHDKFESIKFAPKISAPVLILHGTKDLVVPYEEGQKLFAAIKSKKRLVTIEDAGHLHFGEDFVVERVREFLE